MATKLNKPVTRVVENWSEMNHRDSKRPMVITLNPAGFITFRLSRSHQDYDLDIGSAYIIAVKRFADKQRIDAKRDKAARKAGLS